MVAKLQSVQNGAARIIVRLGKHEHISPVLKELYWLPVELRIVYRIYFLTFKCVHGLGPKFIYKNYWMVYKSNTSLLSSTDEIRLSLARYNMKSYGLRSSLFVVPSGRQGISIFKTKLNTH